MRTKLARGNNKLQSERVQVTESAEPLHNKDTDYGALWFYGKITDEEYLRVRDL